MLWKALGVEGCSKEVTIYRVDARKIIACPLLPQRCLKKGVLGGLHVRHIG
jgi:hypothetical protein